MLKATEEERLAATPLPCGRCLPCRINRSRVWQHRIILEASVHGESLFTTLTYSDDNVPGELKPKDLKNFLIRLRRNLGRPFRYFGVGEYGFVHDRPHYHVMLFGLGPLHRKKIDAAWSVNGSLIGFTFHGEVNIASAGYVAGYAVKKMTNKRDPRLKGKFPEFIRTSNRGGGIGTKAIDMIAEQLLKNPYFKPQIITELKHGKKKWPLGRYLSDRLAKKIGITESQKKANLLAYQCHIEMLHGQSGWYYGNICNEKIAQRIQQEKRFKIFRRKNKI